MKYASQIPRETIARLEAMAAEDPVRFCQPHPCPGVYSSREDEEFWCYKCWGHALEQPMPGSNLAEFFRQQDLQFPLPAGFREERRITVSHGSDCMAVDCICDAYTPHLFDSIADFYLTTDLPTANLESTVYPAAPFGRNQPKVLPGQTRTDCNPRMNTSAGMLDRFVNAGIRYFSTANNHCYDYDEAGLLATLDELDRRGAAHSGTNRSPQEQTQALVLDVGSVRVAELSATFDLNDRAYEKKWLLNEVRFNDTPCDFTLIEQLIASAKAQKADIITLHAHWGWEFELYPHPKTVEYAHKLAEMGVDVIVGTHPHVSQPMEKYTYTQNGEQRSCLIFYSLGDFVSFHPQSRDSRITYVPRYTLAKGELDGRPRTFVTGLQILPVYILTAADAEENYDVRLLRFSDVLADRPDADGAYRYPLCEWERADLPRLHEKILHGILLPADHRELLVP